MFTISNSAHIRRFGKSNGAINFRSREPIALDQLQRRRTREINGIDQNTAINRALWTLAEEMKNLKTA